MTTNVLTDNFSEPLNGATAARIDIHVGDGNLTIERLNGGEQVLAEGALEYVENQGLPSRTLESNNGQAALTLGSEGAGRPRFRLPWAACNGATLWQIHLNPTVAADIIARSGGGNINLDLTGISLASLSAETGGGNMHVILPENAANLCVSAKTGAGKVTLEIGGGITGSNIVTAGSGAGSVTVTIPSGVAARIHAASGMGKVIVDPRFSKIDSTLFQSADFDSAVSKVDLTVQSGAGSVVIHTKESLSCGQTMDVNDTGRI